MNKLWKLTSVMGLSSTLCLSALAVPAAALIAPQASAQGKVMNEYRGVQLDMKQAEVQAKLGKPASSSETADEYKLEGDDLLTVRYENGLVTAIQLLFLDAQHAPPFQEVVGDAEIEEQESGRKIARKVMEAAKFWVTMSQNKDASMTNITIKKM